MTMQTLTEHNEAVERLKNHHTQPAGVTCDKCNHEMDRHSGITWSRHPPVVTVQCPHCGTEGKMKLAV